MKKIRLGMILFIAGGFFAVLAVHGQSNKPVHPKKVKPKAVSVQSKEKVDPVSIPERSGTKGSRQGYKMVTDVLDGFGGESESDNYRISVNSGGEPSAIGISQSNTYMMQAGYVLASSFKRGDPNADGSISSADVVFLIDYLFKNGPKPCPVEAGDANCDGAISSADVVFLIDYLFKGGPSPAC